MHDLLRNRVAIDIAPRHPLHHRIAAPEQVAKCLLVARPQRRHDPLGSRAMYLYQGSRDTLFRIHGTKEPWTIGTNISSGCIRLLNEEIADLYLRTPVGTRVVVI